MITLLVITLLAIILVAFMQTMSLARTSAKSYSDVRQANMAAEAGLEVAIAQITSAIGTNQSFVTGQTNYPDGNFPVVTIGQRDLTNAAQLMPLVSGPTNLLAGFGASGWETNFAAYAGSRTNTNPAISVDMNTDWQLIQKTNNTNLYRASWQVMTNVVGDKTNYTRFAYIVLDEQARLNPVIHNGTGDGLTNAVNWYSGPQDIGLTNPAFPLLTSAQAAMVRASSNAYMWSDAALGQTFGTRSNYDAVQHLFTSQTNRSFDMIPGWLPDGGKSKYNINDLATNVLYGSSATLRAQNIATIIGRNLTNFYSRDPALRSSNQTAYLNRLAANIVDYIDADGEFTTVNGEASGQEISVFPTVFAERVQATQGGISSTPHTKADVDTQFFVSAWNPYTRQMTITNASIRIKNRPNYSFGSAVAMFPPDYEATNAYAGGLVVRPNETIVLAFPTMSLPEMVSPDATTNGPASAATDNDKFIQYELKVNGQTVSKSPGVDSGLVTEGGLEHNQIRASDSTNGLGLVGTNNAWHISILHYKGTTVEDPRFGSFYHTAWTGIVINTYYPTNTYWKGRRNQPATAQGYQDFNALWKNRDYVARNAAVGSVPGSLTNTPDNVASGYVAADAAAAPCVIRDAPMASIGELGNIYDPAHAADDLSTNNSGSSGDNGFVSPYQNGGARSLRIGQPESQGAGDYNWDTNGKRAVELLDLFTVNPTNSTNGGVSGRINPNTAPMEVLSALFSGIKITSDSGMSGGTCTLTNLTNLAQLMISNRPYSALSDLNKIFPALYARTNYNPALPFDLFTGLTKVADRVREEAFGKLVQHFTVQSRAYRVYVIGQVLDAAQAPRGNVILEAEIYLIFSPGDNRFHPLVQYVHYIK